MHSKSQEWLASLSPGDTVLVATGYGRVSYRAEQVQRLTATQIVLPHDVRFRRDNGRRVGGSDSYVSVWLVRPTDELLAKVRADSLASRLERVKWSALPLEVLEAVNASVPE